MKIDTSKLDQEILGRLPYMERLQIYNGLDCCVTKEVFDVLSKQLAPGASLVYDFERGLQALALDMMLRGFRIDTYECHKLLGRYKDDLTRTERILNKYGFAVWNQGLNARSPKQLKEFFYGAMQLPEQYLSTKGVRAVSCNRECLEKLTAYFYATPIINTILEIRDIGKKVSVLSTRISSDGRFRSSFSVASTETGRWSSSKDAFGEGGNQQNITSELRRIFIADKGKKLLHIDGEQAESRVVGLIMKALLNESKYLEACEAGDLHTNVAKILWPDRVHDRESAERIFYRQFSFRDISKRGGHLSNYKGGPYKMARALNLPYRSCVDFQEEYHNKFNFHKWFAYVARELQLRQSLTTPFGMTRQFFGNPYSDDTLREAIAFVPQSTVGQLTALIGWRAWKHLPILEPLSNDHDGFTWQFPDDRELEAKLCSEIESIASIPITLNGHILKIPIDISLGWNWASAEKHPYTPETNPDGLMKWRGQDGRKRTAAIDKLL